MYKCQNICIKDQELLLMSFFEQRLVFQMFFFMENNHKIIAGGGLEVLQTLQHVHCRVLVGVQRLKLLKIFSLYTSRGQVNSLK